MSAKNVIDSAASFSPDERHRYSLFRTFRCAAYPRSVLFVMLNPSTATAEQDDPTIRRCMGFARSWGFDVLSVANIFSLRSTDPKALYADPEASGGSENNEWIAALAKAAQVVVCAWGTHGALAGRGAFVRDALDEMMPIHHLGLTKEGHPKHPLYLRGDTKPVEWKR